MKAIDARTRVSLKNILYATDFSPVAEIALPYVFGLAKQDNATIHALHVRMPYPLLVGTEGIPQIMEAEAEQARFEARQLHEIFASVSHDVIVSSGDLWPILSDMVRTKDIDMIVVGTHGRTGVRRALLGSVAEEIFRKASCPVLTVGPHVSKDTARRLEMKEILYATDFSPESLKALPYAVSLAQEHQARLTLLHIFGEQETGELVHPDQYAVSTLRQLRNLVPPEADFWCEPKFMVGHGPTAEKILEVATALGSDLIVLGVRNADGRMGSTTHLMRPTAHRVVAQAQCPVLTVRG